MMPGKGEELSTPVETSEQTSTAKETVCQADALETSLQSFHRAYSQWKLDAKIARSKLKEFCSSEVLDTIKASVDNQKKQTVQCYQLLSSIEAPSPDVVGMMDTCLKLSQDTLDIIEERNDVKQQKCNARYLKEETRIRLPKEDNKSIFGGSITETKYSASQKSCNSKTDAKAELAAKRIEAQEMSKISKQQEVLHRKEGELKRAQAEMLADMKKVETKLKEELQLERVKLERLKTERDLAPAAARACVYEEDERLLETPVYDLDPEAASFKPMNLASGRPPMTVNHEVTALASAIQDSLLLSRLPTPEPPVFTGNALQYLRWKLAFQALIEGKNLSTEEKMFYLQRYLSGPALKAVEGFFFSMSEGSYYGAWKLLEERYGHKFKIQEAFRDKLQCWPKIGNRDGAALQEYAGFLTACLDAMNQIPGLSVLNDCKENQRLTSKLPDWIATRWNRTVTDALEETQQYPRFADFVKFVSKEARVECNPFTSLHVWKDIGTSRNDNFKQAVRPQFKAKATTLSPSADHAVSRTSIPQDKSCMYCIKTNHYISSCVLFEGQPSSEKVKFVQENKLCFGRLRVGHHSEECKKRHICRKCNRRHPTVMHEDRTGERLRGQSSHINQEVTSNTTTEASSGEATEVHSAVSCKVSEGTDSRTTMIVPVWLSSAQHPHKEVLTYAILDNQSDVSFITKELTSKITTRSFPVRLSIKTVTSPLGVSEPSHVVHHLVVRGMHIEKRIPISKIYTREFIPSEKSQISTGVMAGKDDEPYAVKTDLGWSIISGIGETDQTIYHRIKTKELPELTPCEILKALQADFTVTKDGDKMMSQDDFQFLELLEAEITRNASGRIIMPLPFKSGSPSLPNNRKMALTRFAHLKKLLNDSRYHTKYRDFMQDVIQKGEVGEVSDSGEPGKAWYIPHHGVFHSRKPDKLRVMFDCSAGCQSVSLNSHLLTGPDLTNMLTGVLCRFRQHPVVIIGDIERMFHQFLVKEEHRDYLRFLWWESGDLNASPKEYRMKVHLFGTASSPGCANYGLRYLAKQHSKEFPM